MILKYTFLLGLLLLPCLAKASEVTPLDLVEDEKKFVENAEKRVIPLAPGHGVAVLIGEDLRWYGDDGKILHRGKVVEHAATIADPKKIGYTATGLVYVGLDNKVVLVDHDGRETVFEDLSEAQLFDGINGYVAAISSMTPEGRMIQLFEKSDGEWGLNQKKHPQLVSVPGIIAQANPLVVVHVERKLLGMYNPDRVAVVKGKNIVWESDNKWQMIGVLHDASVALLSCDMKQSELSVVDLNGQLTSLMTLGRYPIAHIVFDKYFKESVIVVGDWQTPEKHRYRSISSVGKLKHDFSRFRSDNLHIYGSHLLFLSGGNALVDPFSGEVLWQRAIGRYFLAEGENPPAGIVAAQGKKIAWCFLFDGENPYVRVKPISDEVAQEHPVSGKGPWRFVSHEGSIWLYCQDSIYRVSL